MIRYSEALNRIKEIAQSQRQHLKTEEVSLSHSVSRICAVDILCTQNIPSFDNSAMDGFALNFKETEGATPLTPKVFSVLKLIGAGDKVDDLIPHQNMMTAYEIMTGAAFPVGYDCCVKIEDCETTLNSDGVVVEVRIREALTKHKNLRAKGHDFILGSKLLLKNEQVLSEHILALASAGITEVEVYSLPKIAIIATGKELVSHESTPKDCQIRNSTAPYLNFVLKDLASSVESFLFTDDDPEKFKDFLKKLKGFDLVITTGAVSMGKFDFILPALNDLNAQIYFHKVAIRPGKPILFAKLKDGPILFSLPGNPVSTVVGFRFFIKNYLKELYFQPDESFIKAKLSKDIQKPEGLKLFLKARVDLTGEVPSVEVLDGQMSSMVSPLSKANAWVVASDDSQRTITKNSSVDVVLLQSTPYLAGCI